MPVTKYNCLMSTNNSAPTSIRTIGVFRGDDIVTVLDSAERTFTADSDGLSWATYKTKGVINSDTTYLVRGDSTTAGVMLSIGCDVLRVYTGKDIYFRFSNGHTIRVTSYSQSGTVTYKKNTYDNTGYYVSFYQSDASSVHGIGITSERLYTSDGNKYFCAPCIASTQGSGNTATFQIPLYNPTRVNLNGKLRSGAFNITSVNNYITNASLLEEISEWLSDFWSDIDENQNFVYYNAIVVDNGGTVTPTNFFSRANEPRMFTVTPDQHHAIYSVNIHNLSTGSLIPYQESAMDLLTGAKSYIFTMPHANVQIVVNFRSLELSIPVIVKYTSPDSGKAYTTSFNLLYDAPREENEASEGED